MMEKRTDRRALLIFFGVVCALATVIYVPVIYAGSFRVLGGLAVPLLMWAPAIAGLIASLTTFRSIRPMGLGVGRKMASWAVVCLFIPVGYTLLIYPALAFFEIVDLGSNNLNLMFLLVGFLQSFLMAAGEELGWRGFASPILSRRFGFLYGQILLGAVWFIYHVPALLFTGYGNSPNPIFGNTMFLISVVALSVFLGWARLQGASVWPCAVFHASHNLVFLHLFDPLQNLAPTATWLVGEQGALLALVLVVTGVYAVRAQRAASLRCDPEHSSSG